MKKILILLAILASTLTACGSKIPDETIDDIKISDTKDAVNKETEFDGITQNEVTNDTSETLSSTFLNLSSVLDREYKSGIINDDTLQIILLAEDEPSEEFEMFYNMNPETTLSLCAAFDIYTINLKVVNDEENPIFEISYSDDDKTYMVAPEYAKQIE